MTSRPNFASHRKEVVLGGLFQFAAYGLVLSALRLSPVSYVAPFREIGILVGVVLGIYVLKERPNQITRIIGAVLDWHRRSRHSPGALIPTQYPRLSMWLANGFLGSPAFNGSLPFVAPAKAGVQGLGLGTASTRDIAGHLRSQMRPGQDMPHQVYVTHRRSRENGNPRPYPTIPTAPWAPACAGATVGDGKASSEQNGGGRGNPRLTPYRSTRTSSARTPCARSARPPRCTRRESPRPTPSRTRSSPSATFVGSFHEL